VSNKVPFPNAQRGRAPQPRPAVYPLVAPTPIATGPTPTDVQVDAARVGADRAVVMQVSTPSGVQIYVLPPAVAKSVGEQLVRHAGAVESGLILLPGGM
jgi:hypothetical protein